MFPAIIAGLLASNIAVHEDECSASDRQLFSAFNVTFQARSPRRSTMTGGLVRANRAIHYPNRTEVISVLHHGSDPYRSTDALSWAEEAKIYRSYAWRNSNEWARVFAHEFPAPPLFIVEVGCFLGGAMAGTWARLLKPQGGLVLAIDTWEGDINMRLGRSFQKYMRNDEKGLPTMYERFLAHMKLKGFEDTVMPLPIASIMWLRASSHCSTGRSTRSTSDRLRTRVRRDARRARPVLWPPASRRADDGR